MALRKIKELIREMVFENQTDEHEYAAVMANLVLDSDKWAEYDRLLEQVKNITKEKDATIQKINVFLEKKKQELDKTKVQKQTLSPDEFKNLMAKLNKHKKILDDLNDKHKREKLDKGFASLDSRIKKYACLRYLSELCIDNSDFKTVVGKDGFIYADDHEFKSSEIAGRFREIRDYTDYIFGNRESKIENEKSIVDIIRADAKNLGIEFKEISAENITQVYNALLNRIAKENKAKVKEQENITNSRIGLQKIRDFGNGLKMYRLMPDTEYYEKNGEHRNLVYESNQMGICIGRKEQDYSQKILKGDENQYYTLRSEEKNGQLVPHCTIEVNGDVVHQVKGKGNGPVSIEYIQNVREFLRKDLDAEFPGDKEKHERQVYDTQNIGFVKDIHDETVDLFNLKPGTMFQTLPWDSLKAIKKDADKIKRIAEIRIDLERMTEDGSILKQFFEDDKKIIAKAHVEKVTIKNATMKCKDLDFGTVAKEVVLIGCDFSANNNLKAGPVGYLRIDYPESLPSDVDFSQIEKLNIAEADFSKTKSVKFNPNAQEISLDYVTGLKVEDLSGLSNVKKLMLGVGTSLSENLDFSGVEDLILAGADLSKVKSIKINPNAKKIDFANSKNLSAWNKIDFSHVKELNLSKTDWLQGDLDFSGVEYLDLSNADLSNVTSIKFNPNAKMIDLRGVRGFTYDNKIDFSHVKQLYLGNIYPLLQGDVDFGDCERVDLQGTDLSKVKSIKAKEVSLDRVKVKLPDVLDLSMVEHVIVYGTVPNGTKIKTKKLDIFNGNLEGDVDFSEIEEVDIRPDANLSNLKSIKAKRLKLSNCRSLDGDIDFSGVEELDLSRADFTKVKSIKFNPNAKKINLENALFLKWDKNWDFSNVQEIILDSLDVVDGKFSGAKKVSLESCNIYGTLDLSNAGTVSLAHASITKGAHVILGTKTNVDIKNAYITDAKFTGNSLCLDDSIFLRGNLDVSNVDNIELEKWNYRLDSVKLNENAKSLKLSIDFFDEYSSRNRKGFSFNHFNAEKLVIFGNGFLYSDLDFGNIKNVVFEDMMVFSSFGGHSVKANSLELKNCTELRGDVDFSQVKHLNLGGIDLSNVKSLKLPEDVTGISEKDLRKFRIRQGIQKVKETMKEKIKEVLKIKGSDNNKDRNDH